MRLRRRNATYSTVHPPADVDWWPPLNRSLPPEPCWCFRTTASLRRLLSLAAFVPGGRVAVSDLAPARAWLAGDHAGGLRASVQDGRRGGSDHGSGARRRGGMTNVETAAALAAMAFIAWILALPMFAAPDCPPCSLRNCAFAAGRSLSPRSRQQKETHPCKRQPTSVN